MGFVRRPRCDTAVGRRHGFSHGAGDRRRPAAPGRPRCVRLHAHRPSLLRGAHPMVRHPPLLPHRSRDGDLRPRRGARHFGHHKGAGTRGRRRAGDDSGLQLLLLLDPQQRLPHRGEPAAKSRPDGRTVHLPHRFRRPGASGSTPGCEDAAPVQPSQSGRTHLDPRRAHARGRDLPPPLGEGGQR